MKETTKVDIKTAKRYRTVLRLLFCLVDFVTPIIFVGIKYKLFTPTASFAVPRALFRSLTRSGQHFPRIIASGFPATVGTFHFI